MRQAVLFDLDDTLIDRTGAFSRALAELLARHPEAIPAAHREEALGWALHLDARGSCRRDAFSRGLLARWPLPYSAEALDEALLLGMLESLAPREEVLALARRVLGRFASAIVSNGSARRQRAKLARSGLGALFGGVFISGELGVAKPDPALLRAALDWTGVAAGRALFVGDDPARDIAPAVALGMETCWISHGRAYPPELPRPTHVIDRVTALEEVLA